MSKLKNNEIDYIIDTYKDTKSIAKTVKITGFCNRTVNKYVKDLSENDIRSRNCKNEVNQIDLEDGSVIKTWLMLKFMIEP